MVNKRGAASHDRPLHGCASLGLRLPSATLALLILLLSSACGPYVPSVAPIPAHAIPVGLNTAFHGFSPDDFKYCPAMIRTPQLSAAALRAFLDAVPEGCKVLPLVEAPDVDLAVALSGVCLHCPIENGNELELPPFNLTPLQYANAQRDMANAERAAGHTGPIIMGGVYALTDETKQAITLALSVCGGCIVGVHLYDASEGDLAWLRWLNAPIWVTEVGFPTRCDPTRLREQKDWLETQIARFSTVPMLERVFLYQRADGPPGDCTDLGTFGIGGKPAETLLHSFLK